jgi:hypothetical protein
MGHSFAEPSAGCVSRFLTEYQFLWLFEEAGHLRSEVRDITREVRWGSSVLVQAGGAAEGAAQPRRDDLARLLCLRLHTGDDSLQLIVSQISRQLLGLFPARSREPPLIGWKRGHDLGGCMPDQDQKLLIAI